MTGFGAFGEPTSPGGVLNFRVHPGALTANLEEGLEGFVCLFV